MLWLLAAAVLLFRCNVLAVPHRVLGFTGYNLGAAALIHPSWGKPEFNAALASLAPGMLRFPSGTYGSCWDWQTGQTVPPCAPTPPNGTTLDDFVGALRVTGAKPILMLNMVTADLNDQLQMLLTAQVAGVFTGGEVMVELGNEFYFGQWASTFADGTEYGRTAARWMAAISASLPNATFAVVATPSFGATGARAAKWNGQVFAALAAAGQTSYAVTMHEYHASALNCAGCALTQARVTAMLAEPAVIAAHMATAVAALPPGVREVWVTEWSLNMNSGAVDAEAGEGP